MKRTELLKSFDEGFKGLGYKRTKDIWKKELKNIDILFDLQLSNWDRSFAFTVGIWFREMGDVQSWNPANSCHLNHNLVSVLMKVGEKYDDFKDLFSLENEVLVVSNISKLLQLIKSKCDPYLQNLDDYQFLVSNFEERIAFAPFFVFYHDVPVFISFFKKQLKTVKK